MATVELKTRYKCSDDCVQSGCPSHELKLEFQSTSDSYQLIKEVGQGIYFESAELEAMIFLLKELQKQRVDSVRI
jgi:hypothetical protein